MAGPPKGDIEVRPSSSSGRLVGVLLSVTAVLVAAPDGTLLRFLQLEAAADCVIFFWKMVFVTAIQFGFVTWQHGLGGWTNGMHTGWPWVLGGALLMAGAATNSIAILETSSAHALLLFYISPLWTLGLGYVVLKEPLAPRTVGATGFALVCVCLLFVPSPEDEVRRPRELCWAG